MSYPKVKGKRIVVTGGAGFIGSNLCHSLVDDNEVVCFDNLATGHFYNIDALTAHKNFRWVEGDIRDFEACKRVVEGADIVLHQAALGSVPRSINDPQTSHDVNVNGFLNVITAARDMQVKRVVYASSSSVYGDSLDLPKVEHKIGKPLSPYAVTKSVNELYAHVYRLNYGLPIIGLRYFNVFGRRQDPNGVYAAAIPKFTMQLLRHESPVINGDGSNSRDFTYIDNIIQLNHLAAGTSNEAALGQVFNGATGDRFDLNQLMALLKENLAQYQPSVKEVAIVHGPNRSGDIPHSLASIDKAKQLLGYAPAYGLKEGLKEAVKWYYEHLRS